MTSINCSRGACKKPINDGDIMFWIANEPMHTPPNDCRSYCMPCGRNITEYANMAGDNLQYAVGRHPFVPDEYERVNAADIRPIMLLRGLRNVPEKSEKISNAVIDSPCT